MNFKRILTAVSLTVLISAPLAYAADSDVDKMREEQCTRDYKQIDNFLQYLYRADGNLKELNSSKIKRIEYLEGVYLDYIASDSKRRTAFNELFNDPDWWVYKLQRNARNLIEQLEAFKKDLNWDTYKQLARQQADGKVAVHLFAPSATRSMEESVKLIYKTADFFTERSEIKDRLDALGSSARLNKVFSEDQQKDGYESRIFFYVPSNLIRCQIDFLAKRMNKNNDHIRE